MWENSNFKKIISRITQKHRIEDIIYDRHTFVKPIYMIQDEHFISEYQGRLYEQMDFITDKGEINSNAMWDYFSEAYMYFFTESDKLSSIDPELYMFIKELVDEKY